jgi:hypothetical protein
MLPVPSTANAGLLITYLHCYIPYWFSCSGSKVPIFRLGKPALGNKHCRLPTGQDSHPTHIRFVRSEVNKAVTMMNTVFCDVTTRSLVNISWRSGVTCYLHPYVSSLLKVETIRSSEKCASVYQTERRRISEGSVQHIIFAELTFMLLVIIDKI